MTQFESAAHKAINLSQAQPRKATAVPVRKAQALAGRGLTFWLQWITSSFLLTLLLLTLASFKTGTIEPRYRILAIFALLGSVPVYSLLRVYIRLVHGEPEAKRVLAEALRSTYANKRKNFGIRL